MVLMRQVLDIPLAGGIHGELDERLIAPGQFVTMQNCTLDAKRGQIRRRHGYSAAPSSTAYFGAGWAGVSADGFLRIGSTGDEIVAVDKTYYYLHAYSPKADRWKPRRRVPECMCYERPLSYDWACRNTSDAATVAGVLAYVWMDASATGNGRLVTLDAATGERLLPDVVLATGGTGGKAKVIASTNGTTTHYLRVFYRLAGVLQIRTLDLANIAAGWSAAAPMPGVGLASDRWDVHSFDTGCVLAFHSAGGITVNKYNTVGLTHTYLYAGIVPATTVAIFGLSGGNTYVVWNDTAATNIQIGALYSADLTVNWAPFVVSAGGWTWTQTNNIGIVANATDIWVTWDDNDATYGWTTYIEQMTVAPAHYGYWGRTYRGHLASKPWIIDNETLTGPPHVYSILGFYTTAHLQNNYFVCSFRTGEPDGIGTVYTLGRARVVGTLAQRYASGLRVVNSLASVVLPTRATTGPTPPPGGEFVWFGAGTDSYRTVLPVAVSAASMTEARGVIDAAIDFSFDSAMLMTPSRGQVYITGGAPSLYDGEDVPELSWHVWPDPVTLSGVGGGGSMNAGNYYYRFTYEWTDREGNVFESAPSDTVHAVTAMAGTSSVTLVVWCTPWTTKQQLTTDTNRAVRIVPYRTTVGGTVFYRVIERNETWPATLTNNPAGAGSLTWVDTLGDSALQTHPILYTQGGTLDNVAPPPAQFACVHKDRLWLACGQSIAYSRVIVPNESPAFNDLLKITIEDGGRITALASMGDWLAVFQAGRVLRVAGDGPSDSGLGNDLTSPSVVDDQHGCVEPRSVVETPVGVMFQSLRGVMLMQGGQVRNVGEPVRDYLSTHSITSAAAFPDQQQVRFTAWSEGVGYATGYVLVYDYAADQWSTFTIHDGTRANAGFLSGCEHNGTHVLGTYYSGKYHYENPSSYQDTTSQWFTMEVVTGWLRAGALQGVQLVREVRVLGQGLDSGAGCCDLTLQIAYDYASSYTTTKTWISSEIAALDRYPIIGIPMRLSPRKSTAIKVRIADADSLGAGVTHAGIGLISLAVEVAGKDGLYRHNPKDRE